MNIVQEVIEKDPEYKRMKLAKNYLAMEYMLAWYQRQWDKAKLYYKKHRDDIRKMNEAGQPKNIRNVAEVPAIFLVFYAHKLGKEISELSQKELIRFMKDNTWCLTSKI